MSDYGKPPNFMINENDYDPQCPDCNEIISSGQNCCHKCGCHIQVELGEEDMVNFFHSMYKNIKGKLHE